MKLVGELNYTKDHEWVKLEGDRAYIGITDYAQDHLGDVVFIELPSVEATFSKGESFSIIESVKAASDVYIPFDGRILEVNEELVDNPEKVNENPYDSWMVLIELSDKSQLDELLNMSEYEQLCIKEG